MSQPWQHLEREETPEGTTLVVRGTIKDDAGQALDAGALTTLTATLHADRDPTKLVTDWNARDVKATGGGSFNATTKEFTLRIPPEANAPLFPTHNVETRVLLLEWTYNGGVDAGLQRIQYPIRNLPHVGAS